ncbi:ribonuclease J [Rhodobacteraceae bacterium NNCM2]|nr:ribonuclease J [Coraliihabitans acroporae]
MTKKNKELVYLALGGAGEIGMNCYLYGLGSKADHEWIMVDLGMGFGDMDTAPGVELVLPDVEFIAQQSKRLRGIFITHAHEDHIGAIPHLWEQLQAPIYARPFTAEVIRRKLAETRIDPKVVHVVNLGDRIKAGDFEVEFLPITHSIPEASMLAIHSPKGTVVHSGDFKLDPAPQMGEAVDLAPYRKLGDEGVLAFACDSTNVFLEGESRSEETIVENLKTVISAAKGAVAATTFASNVSRLRTLAVAATETGRSIVVAGRAMRRMIEVAVETGLLTDFPTVVREEDAESIPRENLFYLVTGSQGENRAAVARIAAGNHPSVKLKEGDTVLFSSKTIPGNESAIYRLYNKLSEQGINVVDGDMEAIHVSGHARRGDLEKMLGILKPRISVPIHGEHRHLVEHAKWAEEWGAQAIVAPNGSVTRLDGNAPEVVEHVETGRIYLDGIAHVGAYDGVIRERLKMARQGHVVVSVVVDEDGDLLADPEVRCLGAPKEGPGWNGPLDEMISLAVDDAIENAPRKSKRADKNIEEIATRAARQVAQHRWGKRPVMTVIVVRLED